MKNIFLVLQREYLTRVRKKSFIVMTLLTPLLIAVFYGVIVLIAVNSDAGSKKVTVIDNSGLYAATLKNTETLQYTFTKQPLEVAKKDLKAGKADVLVVIPQDILEDTKGVKMFAEKNVSLDLKTDIERAIETEIESQKLSKAGIDKKVLADSRANVSAETYSLTADGEKSSNSMVATFLALFLAFLMYVVVFVYGAQIMRGVLEEKTNRIVEVIISSVKPIELMMGKIMGVGLVGLTQFLLWIVLTIGISTAGTALLGGKLAEYANKEQAKVQNATKDPAAVKAVQQKSQNEAVAAFEAINSIPTGQKIQIMVCFLIYFLGGYLLYGSLFGAIGAAVDNETDTQQFMLPLTLPIVAAIMFAQYALRDPDGSVAFWASMVPFTSPIVMMVRVTFGVQTWELLLSISLLVLGFIGTTWLAARIYRVGILMYGKKVSYKELAKWVFYKP